MKRQKNRYFLAVLVFSVIGLNIAKAGDIKGQVIDSDIQEPLMGAAVRISGTNIAVATDFDGKFNIRGLKKGTYTLEVTYVSFFSQKQELKVPEKGTVEANFTLEPDNKQLDEITVVAHKKLELESALLAERKQAVLAIENLGASEMSIKGISNVQDGVKKISGISIADAGQLVVRGLGDRYSTTTLNGLPIASPNPDNKLIPLDIFPSSTVQNITVSKVYEASSFADYSGAHVDISTKEGGEDFFNFSFGTGSKIGTIGNDLYMMDRAHTLFRTPSMDEAAMNVPYKDFRDYIKTHNIFNTTFETTSRKAIPDLSGNLSAGKTFQIWDNDLNLLASLGISSGEKVVNDAYTSIYDATGNVDKYFDYDSYTQTLDITGLFNVGYKFRKADHIGLTAFYARNAIDKYMNRDGFDGDKNPLIGSNQNTHIYELQNYQLQGTHDLGASWNLEWNGSYSKTRSEEPDRRQVMFRKMEDGSLTLFLLNRQETMRYFGSLDESEWVGDLKATYHFGDNNKVRAGFAYKDKNRDYESARFYYNLNGLDADVTDSYHTNGYLNYDNIANGTIQIERSQGLKDLYSAGNTIYAAFLETDYYPLKDLMLNIGLRMEQSSQWVDYGDDRGKPQHRSLDKADLFPALNLRFSASRTITRPSFIEMAPFLYQESYGSAQIRGNADLMNGYNYNVDLRYEFFKDKSNDMLAVTLYYKYLDDPIERIQQFAGGSLQHSFRNAEDGLAAGVELEMRKSITKDLRFTFNGSYMYTNVKLPEDGAYTNSERALQGASPYLLNADLSYTPTFKNDRRLFLTLVYNLQGERIQSVGVAGMGDVKQVPLHTLDFIGNYQFNSRWSLKLQLKNLLNSKIEFEQELPLANKVQKVECYKEGIGFDLSVALKL